jgi:lipopolysaccharide/colanic/teichoic acid biosynthesis glycosyltransferase
MHSKDFRTMSSQPYIDVGYRGQTAISDPKPEAPRELTLPSNNGHRPARAAAKSECHVTPERAWYLPLKRAADIVLSLVLLVVTAPLMLIAGLAVVITSRGPAVYRQVRLGIGGKPFTVLKLRTMVKDAEAKSGPIWSTGTDSRVTPIGNLLRRTHIDEFPQLWNVLLGHMSLVGPRPERPEFVAKLEWEIPYYRERLRVRPGITGLAQLRLPPDSDTEGVRRKVIHDLYYVQYVSPWLDFRLLLLTAWALACELSRSAWNFLALPNQQAIERGFCQAVGIDDRQAMNDAPGFASVNPNHGPSIPQYAEIRDSAE